jgi:HEPN domain-containing protein
MNKKQFIEDWLSKADEDFEAAVYLLRENDTFIKTACFHFQQAAEKYLKAYLTFQNKEFSKTHNIEFLLNLCAEFDDSFKNIHPRDLSEFAVDIRYPDYMYQPTMEETLIHKNVVIEIRNLVQQLIIIKK